MVIMRPVVETSCLALHKYLEQYNIDIHSRRTMSIALAIYFVALQLLGVPALPINGISGEEVLTGSLSPPSVRTKTSIVWSCLVTIFSCTWVAVHPNIPGPNETRWSVFLRRIRLMVVALFAPEAVIMWAMRQWIAAYKLGRKYQCMFISPSQKSVIASFQCYFSVRVDTGSRLFCNYGRLCDL
jgi:hypothetical protein